MNNPYLDKNGPVPCVTEEGIRYLSEIVTDPSGPVYAFKGGNPIVPAAAMARLSRSQYDIRMILLDEFAVDPSKASDMASKIVTGFGDDSVSQLICIHIGLVRISNLATKAVEWGRLQAYLEQSTRYIFFDQKDASGRYLYYTPKNLSEELKSHYSGRMTELFDTYSKMVRELTEHFRKEHPLETTENRTAWLNSTRSKACDAVRSVLPAATLSNIGLVGSAQAIDRMIMNLMAWNLEEFNCLGEKILEQVRRVAAPFFERTDLPHRGGAIVKHIKNTRQQIAKIAENLELNEYKKRQSLDPHVELVDFWPENELDIVTKILFSAQTCRASHAQIKTLTHTLTELEKRDILNTYIGERGNRRHRPGRAFEKAHYEWEFVGDYGTFRDLQRHRMVDDFEWQRLTPYYGYSIPTAVSEAGFEADFRRCYDLSEELYNKMIEAGYEEEAQYATLMGHLMRYSFITNAREAYHLIELRSGLDGHPGYRKLAKQMHELGVNVHPTIFGGMNFLETREDPTLVRLDSEIATERKLNQLQNK
ncbi:MAG: FAD-dependent thymidylate synthase [Candidatus Doudnabacteria bacterium]|nr:FAD-dependent thymidylate synthase [Candidatus Doudnabacteria bacterium]